MTILNKEKILEQAKIFVDEGKFDKAIREYEKILLAEPTDLRVKLKIAELYTKRKQIADAIRIYREVAHSYTADGFLLKAVTVYKNILKLNPALIEVNEELAGLYEKMGLMQDAVRQYDILSSTLDMKGMTEKVIEIRKKIVGLNPQDGAARVKLAETFQRAGRTEEAIDHYEDYASRMERSGADKRKLADVYEKILEHRPKNYDLMRKLIAIYEETGDHKKALKWLEEGKEFTEGEPELLRLAAAIYASQHQIETARAKYLMLAELEKDNDNPQGALDAYFEILVLLPDEEDRLFDRVEEVSPGAMAKMVERAIARRKDIEEAEERRSIDEQTEKTAKEEAQRAEEEQARAAARKPAAVARKPEPSPAPSRDLERTPVLEPEPTKAKPDRGRGDAAYNLGGAYKRMGLVKESEAEFKKALDIYNACIEAGIADEALKAKIKVIEARLAGVVEEEAEPKPRPNVEPRVEPEEQTETTEKTDKTEKVEKIEKVEKVEREKKPQEKEKTEKNKKKISFV